jgi:hypothetical protein
VISFAVRPLYLQGNSPGTHLAGAWVDRRRGLYAVKNWGICYRWAELSWGTIPRSPFPQPDGCHILRPWQDVQLIELRKNRKNSENDGRVSKPKLTELIVVLTTNSAAFGTKVTKWGLCTGDICCEKFLTWTALGCLAPFFVSGSPPRRADCFYERMSCRWIGRLADWLTGQQANKQTN